MKYTDEMVSDDVIHTKFHEDRFGHSGNIKCVASANLEAVVFALLKRGIS
jgi:hypothetical protein